MNLLTVLSSSSVCDNDSDPCVKVVNMFVRNERTQATDRRRQMRTKQNKAETAVL